MNKSQKLELMKLRAKKNVQELLKQHQNSWHGQEPKLVKDIKKGVDNAQILQSTDER